MCRSRCVPSVWELLAVAWTALVVGVGLWWLARSDRWWPLAPKRWGDEEEVAVVTDPEEEEGEVFLTGEEFLESLKRPDAQRVTFEDEDDGCA